MMCRATSFMSRLGMDTHESAAPSKRSDVAPVTVVPDSREAQRVADLLLYSHENIIAILDIIAPLSYEQFHEVYLVQVRPLPLLPAPPAARPPPRSAPSPVPRPHSHSTLLIHLHSALDIASEADARPGAHGDGPVRVLSSDGDRVRPSADQRSHRVIRTQELSDDHCQYFLYQVGLWGRRAAGPSLCSVAMSRSDPT